MSDPVPTIPELEATAKTIRRLILHTTHNAGMGHTGGSLSEAEILTALFFRVMHNRDIANRRADRDRFILSKGHASPGYYSTLALRGYFPIAVLDTLRRPREHPAGASRHAQDAGRRHVFRIARPGAVLRHRHPVGRRAPTRRWPASAPSC